jgi:hypothetical protein
VIPRLAVDVAFGIRPKITPAEEDWVDVSAYVRGATVKRGRNHELSRTETGTLTLQLRNTDRRFDPSNADSPYAPDVVPMTRIRARVILGAVVYARFVGFVTDWGQTWAPRPIGDEGDAEVALASSDAFALLALEDLVAYSAEVLADGPVGYWRLREPAGSTVVVDEGSAGANGATDAGIDLGTSPGPLIGGSTCAVLDYHLEDPIAVGPVADLDLTGDLTIEFWFRPDPDASGRTDLVGGGDAYTVTYTQGLAGELGLRCRTTFGVESSSDPLLLEADVWHHVAVVRSGRIVMWYHDGVDSGVRDHLRSAPLATAFDLSFGASDVDDGGPFGGSLAHVAIYGAALDPTRIAAHATAGFDTFVAQPSGSVLGAILDVVGWDPAERVMDAGSSTIAEFTPSGSALEQMLAVAEDTEGGILMVGADGTVLFHDRTSLSTGAHTVSQVTVSDEDAPGVLSYADVKLANDEQDLWTKVRVERTGGVPQVAEDPDASDRYGTRVLERTGLLLASDLEALGRAQYLLGRYHMPRTRPPDVVMVGTTEEALNTAILARDCHHDRITIRRLPPGGGDPIVLEAAIEGLEDTVTPNGPWQTTWHTVPADADSFWILEDPVFGLLGETTRLGY